MNLASPQSDLKTSSVSTRGGRGSSHKTQKVIEDLRRRIVMEQEWAPDEMLPVQRVLSQEYKVSQATIAIAMRTLQAEGIVEATPGIGTFPAGKSAPSPEKEALPTIGLRGSYLGMQSNVTHDFPARKEYASGVLNSICRHATEIDCSLLLMTMKGRLNPEICRTQGVKGIIFLGGQSYQEAMELRLAGFPVIMANDPSEPTPINYINHDHGDSMTRAVHMFIDHGHERIAVMAPSSSMPGSFQKLKPLYIDALCSREIHYNFSHYWRYVEREDRNACEQTVEELLALPSPPTAIFFFHELHLNWALDVFKRHRLQIPQDLSIISSPYNPYLAPGISGFDIQYEKMAKLLIEGIHKTIENPFYHLQKLIPTKYIDHGTVAPPRIR